MPRQNKGRSIGAEDALARRVKVERESRGWTPESLAKRMTDIGCPIQPSAIYKIEGGTPRRAVRVDELVALSQVFDIPMTSLVVDPDEGLPDDVAESLRALRGELANLKAANDALKFAEAANRRASDEVVEALAELTDGADPVHLRYALDNDLIPPMPPDFLALIETAAGRRRRRKNTKG
ncbi:MAG: helix-turn-helix transcriptional regulator [Candidatus Nanopelagicales bacterium]